MQLNIKTWPSIAEAIAAPAEPDDYSPASVDRLMESLSEFIVHVTGVHPQFRAHNSIKVINFRDEESRKRYEESYNNFLMEKAKIEMRREEGSLSGNAGLQILVQLLKFRMAAELEKVPDICDAMIDAVENNKEAAVASFNFKQSIAAGVRYMVERGIPREKISLIWGGGNSSVSGKRKKKLDLKKKMESNAALMALFDDADVDMYDLGLNGVEDVKKIVGEGDEKLNLGAQDAKERQKNIDRFQSGKALYCFFTLKAGGVGLSLHHSDELTKEKVRRRESGNAVEEDIPLIPVRPRRLFGATTYSAIELVQMLGRCPRLTSLSDTYQTILFYKNTIEERVAAIVSLKLRCLRKVSRGVKESWESVILGGYKADDKVDTKVLAGEQTIKDAEGASGDDDQLVGEETESEEEE